MLLALWQACALACLASLSVNASPAQIDMGSASHMRALRDVVLPLAQASALGNVVSANVSQLPAAPAANGTLLLPVLNGTMPDDQDDNEDSSTSVQSASGPDPPTQRYQGPVSSSCVCAFDFDLTLRIPLKGKDGKVYEWDAPGYESFQVLKACQSVPCHFAIASANDGRAKIQKVLTRNYGSSLFDPGFFSSQAFQVGIHNKTVELLAIQAYYGVKTQCIVLFDDSWFNRKYAERIGAHFEQVSNYTGVARWNFDRAMQYGLPSWCFSNGQRPPKIDNKGKDGSRSSGSSSSSSGKDRDSGKIQATQGPGN